MMTRSDKMWAVILVAALGAWGCARGTASPDGTQAERLRQVEAKCAKLEHDYKALSVACEQAKSRLAELVADNGRLKKELACRTRELETVRKDAEGRTSERDALQARCDRLKKGIQALLGQDDAMLATPVPPVSAAPTGPVLAPS